MLFTFTARTQAHHDNGLVLIEGRLSRPERRLDVLVIQNGLDDVVAVRLEASGLHAADDGVPAVEVEDFHWWAVSFSAIAARHLGQHHGAGAFTGIGLR